MRGIRISKEDGGSVVTRLGFGIKVNENSSLRRALVVINDPGSPVQLDSTGIRTSYSDRRYVFRPTGNVKAKEAISALEIRYLLFDMFGKHMKTLSITEVADIDSGKEIPISGFGSWRARETEVSRLLTIVSFVGNVRTADEKLWMYRQKPINEELQKIRLTISEGALDPTKEEN